MIERIAVTGQSLICSLGEDTPQVVQKLMAGQSGLSAQTLTRYGETQEAWVGQVTLDLKKELGGVGWRNHNRASLMACLAGKKLKAELSQSETEWIPEDIGVIMGYNHNIFAEEFEETLKNRNLSLLNPPFFLNISTNSVASQVTIYLHVHAFAMTATSGFLSSLETLDQAVLALRAGRAQIVWAGGAEENNEKYVLSFAAGFLLPEQPAEGGALVVKSPNRIPAGEGCALLQLEKESTARAQGRKPLAFLSGFGMGVWPESQGLNDPRALEGAIQAALREAGLAAPDIGALFVAANGNGLQDQAEARAIKTLFGERVPPAVALKGALGETYHAHGALSAAVAITCLQQRKMPPTLHLADNACTVALNLSQEARTISARHALILAMEQDRKAAALIISLPQPEA